MEVVAAILWAVSMVTVVSSKPVCLHADDDSSKSSESSESRSSEETDVQFGFSQPALTGTNHLDPSPSLSTLDTAALPTAEDPQTSSDIDPVQPIPENPCQTVFHVDKPKDTALDSLDAGVILSTKEPKGTSAYEGLMQETTPPVPMQVMTPTPPLFSTDTPLTIPVENTPADTSDCFTIQLTTPEPAPPRGDNK